jgi:hypothetical protein
MCRVAFVPVILAVCFPACATDSIAPLSEADAALRIVATGEPEALGALEIVRATISGPATQAFELRRSDNGYEATVEEIPVGTYRVMVEGLVGGEVDHFGDAPSVRVTMNETSSALIALQTFVPTLNEIVFPATVTTVHVSFSAVAHATGYAVEVDTDPEFSSMTVVETAEPTADVFLSEPGTHYVRVRAINELNTRGRASQVRSSQVVTDQMLSGDDAGTAGHLGVGTGANGTYRGLNILPAIDEDWFAVEVHAGDGVTVGVRSVSLNPPSALDPVVALIDPEGRLVVENDNASAGTSEARLQAVVDADGAYFLRVAGVHASAGHYELDVQVVASAASQVAFQVLHEVHTATSSVRERRRAVIRSEAEWLAFWDEFTGTVVPKPAPPQIDFAQHMVIVAAMGERPTGGYLIDVESVTEGDGGLTVLVAETSPAQDCAVTQVLTAPITAVVVPRNEGTVTFVEEGRTQACS